MLIWLEFLSLPGGGFSVTCTDCGKKLGWVSDTRVGYWLTPQYFHECEGKKDAVNTNG